MSLTPHCSWQLTTQVATARAVFHFIADLFLHVETSVCGDVYMRLTSASPFVQHVKKKMCN